MGREALWRVYALAAPGLPRRFRVAGRALTSIPLVASTRSRSHAIDAIAERAVELPPVTEAALREQHAVVVALWRRTDRLIPVRFGTVATETDLKARILPATPMLARMLQTVGGRAQMTVRVFEETPANDPDALPRTSGTAYLTALRDRAAGVSRLAEEIRRPVARFVVEERVAAGQGALRLSVFHLIAAADEPRYRAALGASVQSVPGRRLTVSGPWPPFAFAPELFR
jgi:hypothetical protein